MITTTTARQTFVATATSGAFPFNAPVFDADALGVVAVDGNGVEYFPPFTVTLADDRSGATANVTSGLTVGDKVVVYRVLRRKQAQPFNPSGPVPGPQIERQLDRITVDLQALAILAERALGVSMVDDGVAGNIAQASVRAGKLLGFDVQGRATYLTNVPLDPAIAVSGFMQSLLLDADALAVLGDLGVSSLMAQILGDNTTDAALGHLGLSTYFRTLVAAADSASLRSLIEVSNLASAFIDNGACQVAQIPSPVGLTTSPQHTQVDRFSGWASGGAVSAGTMGQNTSSGIGRAGYSLKFAGTTLTGAGQLSVRYHLEAASARRLRNSSVSFGVLASHDVGSNVNYTVILRKPTAADNYASTTTIATSSAQAVPSGISSGTRVKFENQAVGDITNGLEIEIRIACGAVTAKNFELTEFVLAEAPTAPAFQSLNTYVANLSACQRYLRRTTQREFFSGEVASGSIYRANVRFDAPMHHAPTVTLADAGVNNGFPAVAPDVGLVSVDGFDVAHTANSSVSDGNYAFTWLADARLTP